MQKKTLDDWLHFHQNLHNKTIDLGLKRVTKVYQKLFPNGVNFKVITIAGTNGKGSTGAFIASILHTANIKYGWFSSPHIHTYNERFIINNNIVSDEDIIKSFELIEQARGDISLSYFEFSTLTSLILFSQKKIAVAILEIGLGGRLDSVNAVLADVSIITSISLDHTDLLGTTIDEIAKEKAGIIKANKYCILAPNLPQIIFDMAQSKNAKIIKVNKYEKTLLMRGEWQKYNASLAKNAIKVITDVDDKIIDKALSITKIEARYEVINFSGKKIIFDIAHNPAAVKNLSYLLEPNTLAIFAALENKDIKLMISQIEENISEWYLIELTGERTITAIQMQSFFTGQKTVIFTSVKKALNDAINSTYKNIIVFGSFLSIKAVKEIIINDCEKI